jgi:hypothetical protein
METTATFTINTTGEDTGRVYSGKFKVKTILSRRDNFVADERRRMILGTNPTQAAPALQGEAYILGQLFVRIIEAPKFWQDSDNGLDIEDANVIGEIFKLTIEKQEELKNSVKDEAEKAVKNLSKKVKAGSEE